jgi:aminoglycoside phosphotransferase family enzyme/predicted kinase
METMAENDNLPPLIRALLSPAAYDHPVSGRVNLVQTHISFVLLAGDYAYKIKKPLDLGFLDYSTLERRRRMCEEEVRLNRRLCAGVYLGVASIVPANGGFHLSDVRDDDQAIEYAVKMRRLAQDRMMPELLDRGRIGESHVRALARLLAAFHARSETSEYIASFGRPDALRENWGENFSQIAPFVGRTIDERQLADVGSYVEAMVTDRASLLHRRADARKVRDCHGDLRSDAVAFDEDGSICVMDCIEFNDRIRYGDVAGDIGFLAMDLDFRGRHDLADALIGSYIGATRDESLPLVLPFYKCYRAFIRGKVDSLLMDESEVPHQQRGEARERARRYFSLAAHYAGAHAKSLIVMVGLTGSGKSHLAYALAGRVGAAVISSDAVREERSPRTAGLDEYGAGRYARDESNATYEAMRRHAAEFLQAGGSVILDATHISREEREQAYALAQAHSARLLVVHVRADEATIRRHLDARAGEEASASEGRWEIYEAQLEAFEPIDEVSKESVVNVNGAAPPAENIARVTRALA